MARKDFKEAPSFYTIRNLGVDERASIMSEGINYEIIDDTFSAFYEEKVIADKISFHEGESLQIRCEEGEDPMVIPVDNSPSEKEEDTDVVDDGEKEKAIVDENVATMLPQVSPAGPVIGRGVDSSYVDEELPEEIINFSESVLNYMSDPDATYSDVVEEGVEDAIVNLKTKVAISYKTRKLIIKINILKAKIKAATKKNTDNATVIDMKRAVVQLQKELNQIKNTSTSEEKAEISKIEKTAERSVKSDKTITESTMSDMDEEVFTEAYNAHKGKRAYFSKTEDKYNSLNEKMAKLKNKEIDPEDRFELAYEASDIISELIVEAAKIPNDGFFDSIFDINFFINGLKKILACFKASFTFTGLVVYRPRTQRSVVIASLRKIQSDLDDEILKAKKQIRKKKDESNVTESVEEVEEATAVSTDGRINYWSQMISATKDKLAAVKDAKESEVLQSKIKEYEKKIEDIKNASEKKSTGVGLKGKMHSSYGRGNYVAASTDDVIPDGTSVLEEADDLRLKLETATNLYEKTGDDLYAKKIRGINMKLESLGIDVVTEQEIFSDKTFKSYDSEDRRLNSVRKVIVDLKEKLQKAENKFRISGNDVDASVVKQLKEKIANEERKLKNTEDAIKEKMIDKDQKNLKKENQYHGTLAFESVDDTMTEAANMEDEIKPVVAELNRKGYKVKYSSPGHMHLRKKEDNEPDGVYYGKLYSDARVMFDDDYKLPAAPKYWKWRIVDNCDYLDIVPLTYNDTNGTPDEAFKKWKDDYMNSLKEYVKSLPEKGTTKKDDDVKEESVDPFEDILLSLDPEKSYMIEHTEISKGGETYCENMLITEFASILSDED